MNLATADTTERRHMRTFPQTVAQETTMPLHTTRALGGLLAALATFTGATASAQTLNMMKALDSPHYDGQRTTWSPTSDIVNMIQDTLVALDWDGKTPHAAAGQVWTISPDGKLYTFKLRDDVQFCSGKKFTAADVVYSFNRQKDPATKAPYAWRAGNIKELRAPDPYTVEYELNEPFSDLLVQLTMFNNASTTRRASRRWARTTASRASTAPAPGAS
jgi:peptide/nickel transport system substrate-binding protein